VKDDIFLQYIHSRISNYDFGILLKLELEHFKQERHNFVTINDIYRLLYALDTLEKIKILISKSLGNLSFSHRGIAEEFKEEGDNFVTINDISKFTNSIMTIPNLGKR